MERVIPGRMTQLECTMTIIKTTIPEVTDESSLAIQSQQGSGAANRDEAARIAEIEAKRQGKRKGILKADKPRPGARAAARPNADEDLYAAGDYEGSDVQVISEDQVDLEERSKHSLKAPVSLASKSVSRKPQPAAARLADEHYDPPQLDDEVDEDAQWPASSMMRVDPPVKDGDSDIQSSVVDGGDGHLPALPAPLPLNGDDEEAHHYDGSQPDELDHRYEYEGDEHGDHAHQDEYTHEDMEAAQASLAARSVGASRDSATRQERTGNSASIIFEADDDDPAPNELPLRKVANEADSTSQPLSNRSQETLTAYLPASPATQQSSIPSNVTPQSSQPPSDYEYGDRHTQSVLAAASSAAATASINAASASKRDRRSRELNTSGVPPPIKEESARSKAEQLSLPVADLNARSRTPDERRRKADAVAAALLESEDARGQAYPAVAREPDSPSTVLRSSDIDAEDDPEVARARAARKSSDDSIPPPPPERPSRSSAGKSSKSRQRRSSSERTDTTETSETISYPADRRAAPSSFISRSLGIAVLEPKKKSKDRNASRKSSDGTETSPVDSDLYEKGKSRNHRQGSDPHRDRDKHRDRDNRDRDRDHDRDRDRDRDRNRDRDRRDRDSHYSKESGTGDSMPHSSSMGSFGRGGEGESYSIRDLLAFRPPHGSWIKELNSGTSRCGICRDEFSFSKQPHHCYFCGGLYCSNCASRDRKFTELPFIKKAVRCCDRCMNEPIPPRISNMDPDERLADAVAEIKDLKLELKAQKNREQKMEHLKESRRELKRQLMAMMQSKEEWSTAQALQDLHRRNEELEDDIEQALQSRDRYAEEWHQEKKKFRHMKKSYEKALREIADVADLKELEIQQLRADLESNTTAMGDTGYGFESNKYAAMLEASKRENDVLRSRIEDLEMGLETSGVRSSSANVPNQYEKQQWALQAMIDTLEVKVKDFDQTCTSLRARCSTLRDMFKREKEEHQVTRGERDILRDKLAQMGVNPQMLKSLESKVQGDSEAPAGSEGLMVMLGQLRQERDQLVKSQRELSDRLARSEERELGLQDELEKATSQLETVVTQHEQTATALHTALQRVEQLKARNESSLEHSATQATIVALEQELHRLRGDVAALSQERDTLNSRLQKETGRAIAAEEKVFVAESELRQANTELRNLEQDLIRTEGTLEEYHRLIVLKDEELSKARDDLNTAIADAVAAHEEAVAALAESNTLSAKVGQLEEEVADLKSSRVGSARVVGGPVEDGTAQAAGPSDGKGHKASHSLSLNEKDLEELEDDDAEQEGDADGWPTPRHGRPANKSKVLSEEELDELDAEENLSNNKDKNWDEAAKTKKGKAKDPLSMLDQESKMRNDELKKLQDANDQMVRQIDEIEARFQDEKQRLADRITILEKELQSERAKSAGTSPADIAVMKGKLATLEEELTRVSAERDEVKAKLEESEKNNNQAQVAELGKQVTLLSAERDSIFQRLKATEEALAASKALEQTDMDELEEMDEDDMSKSTPNTGKQGRSEATTPLLVKKRQASLEEEKKQLESELQSATERHLATQKELHDKLAAAQAELKARDDAIQAEKVKANDSQKEIESKLARVEAERTAAATSLEAERAEAGRLKADLGKLRSEVDQLVNERNELKSQLQQAQDREKDLKKKLGLTQSELEAAKIEKEQALVTAAAASSRRMSERENSGRLGSDKYEQENKELRAQLEKADSEFKRQLADKEATLQSLLETASSQLEDQEKETERLRRELQAVKASSTGLGTPKTPTDSDSRIAALTAERDRLIREHKEAVKKLELTTKRVESQEQEMAEMRKLLENLAKEYEESMSERTTIINKADETFQHMETEHRETVAKLQKEIATLTQKLNEANKAGKK